MELVQYVEFSPIHGDMSFCFRFVDNGQRMYIYHGKFDQVGRANENDFKRILENV